MSFEQKKKNNLHYRKYHPQCDGCEKHCKLGWIFNGMDIIHPAINGTAIEEYYNEENILVYPEDEMEFRTGKMHESPYRVAEELAHRITYLCDHYKTR